MILDKLMEKKDLKAYLAWRMKILRLELIPDKIKTLEPKKRELAKLKIKGRLAELHHILSEYNHIKEKSQGYCKLYYKAKKDEKK